jgi:hypothetical protein
MKKLFFCLIGLSIIFPVLTWGEDTDGDNEYIPRTVATGDISEINDAYGDIVRYRYNPIGEHWKLRTNKCAIKYNPMENHWTYVYPGEVLRFNPAENDWDYQFTEKRLRYDITDEKWFYGYSLLKSEQEHPGTLTSTSPKP